MSSDIYRIHLSFVFTVSTSTELLTKLFEPSTIFDSVTKLSVLEHQRNQRYFQTATTHKHTKSKQRTNNHVISTDRRRAVPPQRSVPMESLLSSIGHTTNEGIIGRKMILMKTAVLYPSIVGAMIVCASHQPSTSASLQPPTMPSLSSHQSAHCIIGRTMILRSFVLYLSSSFLLPFDHLWRRRQRRR